MNPQEIQRLLKDNPSIRILRSPNAPLILGCLYEVFKKTQRITISNEELIITLAAFIEEYETEHEGDSVERSRLMIEEWCNENNRYLRKYPDERGNAIHELTGHLERVFRWLEDLKPKEFVGTESRFSDILRRLSELVEKTTEDPQQKIKDLEKKKEEIEQEIARIRQSGIVEVFSGLQIQERFEDISRNARDLLSDFKEVEHNFKVIIDLLYKEEVERNSSRGSLLGFTLDAHEEMKTSPQGRSFHSFWNFLIADSGEDRINKLVEQVYTIVLDKKISYRDDFLKKLKYYLYQAGKRIIDSNHMLADKINKMLTESSILQRKKVKELIEVIKKTVLSVKDKPPDLDAWMSIQGNPEISISIDRPLSFPMEKTEFKSADEAVKKMSEFNMSLLFDQFFINRKKLESQIQELLKEKPQVTLEEVVSRFPLEKGLAEFMIYYEIASASKRARISDKESFMLHYDFNKTSRDVKAPEVLFWR